MRHDDDQENLLPPGYGITRMGDWHYPLLDGHFRLDLFGQRIAFPSRAEALRFCRLEHEDIGHWWRAGGEAPHGEAHHEEA